VIKVTSLIIFLLVKLVHCCKKRGFIMCLSLEIEILREKMIIVGLSKGLNSPETLKISEALDKLINSAMEHRQKSSR
jgi:hypothetical protein